MEKIRPIKRPSVSEQVCDQMKEHLFEGRWKPGEKIPTENELARSFGVSRLTIREALLRLSSLGFLESRFGAGTYVREITPGLNLSPLIPVAYLDRKSILDVVEYRLVMEVKTAGLAARRATPEDIAVLEENWAAMDRAKGDPRRFAEVDLGFHLELAKITRNSLLIETQNIIRSILSQAMFEAIRQRGTQGLRYHRMLIEAIRKNDEAETMRLMEEHINNVYNTMRDNLMQEGKPEGGVGTDIDSN